MLDVDDDNIWRINLFEIMGVPDGCDKEELRRVYKKLAKQYHPDRFKAGSEEQEEAKKKFSAISQAYEILSNDIKRNQYLETRRILADHLAAEEEAAHPQKPKTAASKPRATRPKAEEPVPKKAEPKEDYKRKEAEELYQEGQQYFRKNKMDEAISSFQQAISIVSDNSAYHSYLGRAYLNKEWMGMAQASFKKALVINPHDPVAKKYYEPEKPKKKGLFGGLFSKFSKK